VRDGQGARVRAIGELDTAAVPALAKEIAQVRDAGYRHVVIDLSELSFLDSSGLRFLLDCYTKSRQDGHTIALLPGPPSVQRVFELTRTTEHLPFMQPSERELVLAAKECRGEARGALIEAFTPQIEHVASGYGGVSEVRRAELMQQGVVGLLRALERYDPELGTPFWAYASWWVRHGMQQLSQ
jgi:anti-anti-sigma factor